MFVGREGGERYANLLTLALSSQWRRGDPLRCPLNERVGGVPLSHGGEGQGEVVCTALGGGRYSSITSSARSMTALGIERPMRSAAFGFTESWVFWTLSTGMSAGFSPSSTRTTIRPVWRPRS